MTPHPAEKELPPPSCALQVLSAFNKLLPRIDSEAELLDAICRVSVDTGAYRMAWVGFVQETAPPSIRPKAHAGHEDGYLSQIPLEALPGDFNPHPAHETIRRGIPILCENIAYDRDSIPGRAQAEQRGYRSFIYLPLRSPQRTFGLLALYSGHPRRWSNPEIILLQELADTVAFGLDYIRANSQARQQAALLDAAQDALMVKDLDQRITFWNKGAESIYGWTAQEAIGQKANELLHKDPSRTQSLVGILFEKGEWRGELRTLTKTGQELTVEVRWRVLRDAEGRPDSILALNSDITERKRLESQFLRAQRMESIGALAGGIAHDLNNALTPILMAIELLGLNVNDDGREILARLKESAQHGSKLVKQMLAFARGLSSNHIGINPAHLIQGLDNIIRDTFPKNITFSFRPSPELWSLVGDPTQLHQVLTNLCLNARDAMPNGGQLLLSMENVSLDEVYAEMNSDASPGPHVKIEVRDTGSGIPPATLKRIFDPFFTTKEIGKGTGLGLSSALAIVKNHHGFINVYSELGNGTTFKVYLPADASPATPSTPERNPNRCPRGNGSGVLVVDDDDIIRSVAKKTLERFGYRVLLASNGAEAVALYADKRDEIAVVLTDMAMPIMDGSATILALRSLNPLVKIIGSTGLASYGAAAKPADLGLLHMVPKPYTAENLLTVLAEVLAPSL